jgi:uncharacterized membrane protein YfcA
LAGLGPLDVAALAALAFATSVLSAVIGMAGGLVLLSAMLVYMDPLQAIPVHAAVQLVANGSRAIVQREHVAWNLVACYAPGLLPFGWLGIRVVYATPADLLQALIGGFVLVATWRPGWLLFGQKPGAAHAGLRFAALGAVIGFLQVLVGAVGMLVAPFFLPLGLSRQSVIGTQACMQSLGHLVKIVLFGLAGFALAEHALLLLLLAPLVIAGTWAGSLLLDRVPERVFVVLYRSVLTLLALRLVVIDGVAAL